MKTVKTVKRIQLRNKKIIILKNDFDIDSRVVIYQLEKRQYTNRLYFRVELKTN